MQKGLLVLVMVALFVKRLYLGLKNSPTKDLQSGWPGVLSHTGLRDVSVLGEMKGAL